MTRKIYRYLGLAFIIACNIFAISVMVWKMDARGAAPGCGASAAAASECEAGATR